jgi:hypothetical protein
LVFIDWIKLHISVRIVDLTVVARLGGMNDSEWNLGSNNDTFNAI